MTKSEFNIMVDNLLRKLDRLTIGDNREVSQVISEFKHIVSRNYNFLNNFVVEDLGRVEYHLKESRRYKRYSLKEQNWNWAVGRLFRDIESMKSENTFPKK